MHIDLLAQINYSYTSSVYLTYKQKKNSQVEILSTFDKLSEYSELQIEGLNVYFIIGFLFLNVNFHPSNQRPYLIIIKIMYHSLDIMFEEAPASSSTSSLWSDNDDGICNGESELIGPWWGVSDIIILIGGCGLRNLLVVVGMMEHLQSGQVEFDCSQWCMQSMWNTCLQCGICSTSSFTSNSPKQTQHLFFWQLVSFILKHVFHVLISCV